MKVFYLFLILLLSSVGWGDSIRVPDSEAVIELLTDLNGVIERKGDLVAIMNLYSFEKKFEDWDDSDFSLFENKIRSSIHDGSIERGRKYPARLVQNYPWIIVQLKEAQKRFSKEKDNQRILKELRDKIYAYEREISRGKGEDTFSQSLQEWKTTVDEMQLYPGGEADLARESILLQIAKLQGSQGEVTEREAKRSHQQEMDRLSALQIEKQEHRKELIRWGIFAVVSFLIFAFWWSRQQSMGGE